MTDQLHQGWAAQPQFNPPTLAVDPTYQRHLQRHANKVLLRVRLLYYLKQEVIADMADAVMSGANATELDFPIPWQPEIPIPWWDLDADRSLLVGTYKHGRRVKVACGFLDIRYLNFLVGYENFRAMRLDPKLCFLSRCGLPPADNGIPTSEDNFEDIEDAFQDGSGSATECGESSPPKVGSIMR